MKISENIQAHTIHNSFIPSSQTTEGVTEASSVKDDWIDFFVK